MHLEGKAAIVTGAGRGIGRDVALLLAREGVRLIVNDPGVGRGGEPTDERPADDVVNEIRAAGGTAIANYDSVGDYQKAGRMVAQCVDTFGKIDILVNVAGMLRERMIWNMSEDDFDTVINVHLKGHWAMSHHAIKYMRREGYGRIVNFSSDAFKGSVGQCNYSAAKAGIIAFTKSTAQEVAPFGIRVNAVCPGWVKTEMDHKDQAGGSYSDADIMEHVPMGRFAKPDDIAQAIAFLCDSSKSAFINGVSLPVDGGWTADGSWQSLRLKHR
jgi:3-oxoacyl-[acyl-carrier protein] reductase